MKISLRYTLENQLKSVLLSEYYFAGLALLLGILLAIFLGNRLWERISQEPRVLRVITQQGSLPAEKEVYKVIDALSYSGLEMIKQRGVSISVDFKNAQWRLKDIERFDRQGNLLLAGGRYGTCLQLCIYTYNKIMPLLGKDYDIDFMRVAQSGHFLYPIASHIVLRIASNDKSASGAEKEVYILDPSFGRYGPEEDFKDYLFLREVPASVMLANRQSDILMSTKALFPLLIKGDYLIGLLLEDKAGEFNRDNFILAVKAIKKYDFSGEYLFALRRNNGVGEVLEVNTVLAKELLGEKGYSDLCRRLRGFFKEIR